MTKGNNKIKIGDVFGKLTVVEYVGKDEEYRNLYLCKCDCGNEKIVTDNKLLSKNTKSCGCLKIEKLEKHGLSKTKIYQVWQQIISRCYTETCNNYSKYGAKGILVCDEWKSKTDGFINFYNWAINNGYYEGLTIDRIDTYGNYEPKNCRWATYEEQNTNLRMLKNNKSGYRGCFYLKKYNKWKANISIKNKSIHIGQYDTLKECVEARNDYIDKNNLPHQKNIWRGDEFDV